MESYGKRTNVNFHQRALVYLAALIQPLPFAVIGAKMLQGSPHARALKPRDIAFRRLPCKIGILGKIFEVSSAQRRALDVDAGRQQHVHARLDTFGGKRLPDSFRDAGIPGVCQHVRSGIAARRRSFGIFRRFYPQPAGTVRRPQNGQFTVEALRFKTARSGQKP